MQNHAADTYSEFAEQNKELLQSIPPPLVALNYYKGGDLYLFDALQTGWPCETPRRPSCTTLYDVFINIRDDEIEHVKTMSALKKDELLLGDAQKNNLQGRIRVLDTFDDGDTE